MEEDATISSSSSKNKKKDNETNHALLSSGDLKAFFNIVPAGRRAYWVVCSNVFCMMSADIHPKKWCSCWKSGVCLTMVFGIIVGKDVGASKTLV
jgi:hypothetical protein